VLAQQGLTHGPARVTDVRGSTRDNRTNTIHFPLFLLRLVITRWDYGPMLFDPQDKDTETADQS